MTGPGDNDDGQPDGTEDPVSPWASSQAAWEGLQPRVATLEAWIAEHQAAYTSAALERSAIESGYTKEEFDRALFMAGRREREQRVIGPLKTWARVAVIVAYVGAWLLFARVFVLNDTSNAYYGFGVIAQMILTFFLGIAIVISMAWINARRPDPDHVGLALVTLLVVPIVLLVGVAGLCFQSTGGSLL